MTQTAHFVVGSETSIHCEGCEQRIGKVLKRLPGVEAVTASHKTQEVSVTFDSKQVSVEQIRAKLARAGFAAAPHGGNA